MSYIFKSKNIRFFLLIFAFLISVAEQKENYTIKQLENFSFISDIWNQNQSYIYYLDIESYKIGEENIFQILGEGIYLVNNITVSQIDESIIFDNTSEIIKKETYKKEYHIKLRKKPRRHYFEILINKTKKSQKYFVVLVEPNLSQNNTEVEIMISSIVQNIYIDKKDISYGKIYSTEFYMDAKIEKFKKIIFRDISLEKSNLLLFIGDKGVSGFYMNNITTRETRTRLLIVPKNSTQDKEHIIYLSLIGPANKTKFQIMLDEHDISYIYGYNRLMTSFYLEKLNCTNDYYIFEDYYTDEDKSNKVNHLDINSIYGDYELIYYEIIGSNISNIFIPENSTKEILNDSLVKRITSDSNILKFSCKKPTLLKIKYIQENVELNLTEGQEKIIHYDKCLSYYKIYTGNKIITKDINREYKFYFGYYKLNETEEIIYSELTTAVKGYFTPHSLNKKDPFFMTKIYYDKDRPSSSFSLDVNNDNIYFKIYLISNQYYKNVIEGVTKINLDEKSLAFKIRKDIVFDYFIFKAYSFNKSNLISLEYDLKIVGKDDVIKDKVMVGMNPVKDFLKNEIIIRYSNPYDKFNSNIKEDDFVYLLILFITSEKYFPIYVDIRYYYNNSIISIKPSEPEIILNNREYQIFGDNNTDVFEKIMLNINKCNQDKSYSVKTFYENMDNLVLIEKITDERTFLFHENLFYKTKLLFFEEQNKNNNASYKENTFQQNSYYQNGDLYMNYFPYNEDLYSHLKLTNDFSITYEDGDNGTIFRWNDYLILNDYLLNESEKYPVNYSIYIFPKTSPINSICQMSLIPPNISLINQNSQEFYLEKGEYKINIMASIVNKNFPLITHYNFLEFDVPYKYNIKLIIILSVSGFILIALVIILIVYCKKKKKKDEFEDVDINRESRIQSMVKAWGLGGEKEHLFLNNDDEEDESENIINNDDKNNENEEKEKEEILKEKTEENNFSTMSEK